MDGVKQSLARLEEGHLPPCGERALQEDRLVVVEDLSQQCPDCYWCGPNPGWGALVTPLTYQGVRYGCLGVQLPDLLTRDEEELALFRELAADVSLALYKMDLEGREQQALKALQTSEKKYRQIVETANEGIWAVDENSCTTFINGQMAGILGYPPEEILGHPVTDFFFPEDLADHEALLEQRRQGQSGLYERRLHTRDDREIWALVSGTPIFDEANSFRGTFGMFMDITERKRAEGERLKIDKLEALGVLAGGLAHDLNNVLMGILGNLSLATGALSARELETRLAAAEAACGQAQTLARHLLTFAKGGTPIKQPQDLKELVQEASRLAVCGSRARVEFDLPEDLWAVEVDRGQMHQVFSNLLINAVQAMPSGGIIRVQAENVELTETTGFPLPAGKYMEVTVADQGAGISPENLAKIFDPYFTTKKQGTGLGLATTYAIISQHGGRISVTSEVGRGTTFEIILPAREKTVHDVKPAEAKALEGHGRILVMDDDVLVREVVGKMLRKLGYEPVFAQEGGEALHLYGQA